MKPPEPDAAADAVEIAERGLGLGEDIDGAALGRGAARFDGNGASDLADMVGIDLAVVAERSWPEIVRKVPEMTAGT